MITIILCAFLGRKEFTMKKILFGIGIGVVATIGYTVVRFRKGVKVGDLVKFKSDEE